MNILLHMYLFVLHFASIEITHFDEGVTHLPIHF